MSVNLPSVILVTVLSFGVCRVTIQSVIKTLMCLYFLALQYNHWNCGYSVWGTASRSRLVSLVCRMALNDRCDGPFVHPVLFEHYIVHL